MEVATMTDAAVGTEVYYLQHIYILLFLIFVLLFIWYFGIKIRSMYRKILRGEKDEF